jgi:hypothetical protein
LSTQPTMSWLPCLPCMISSFDFPHSKRRRSQRNGWLGRFARNGGMGTSWWMAPSSRYSSGLVFTVMLGSTRAIIIHSTARCVYFLSPKFTWSDVA